MRRGHSFFLVFGTESDRTFYPSAETVLKDEVELLSVIALRLIVQSKIIAVYMPETVHRQRFTFVAQEAFAFALKIPKTVCRLGIISFAENGKLQIYPLPRPKLFGQRQRFDMVSVVLHNIKPVITGANEAGKEYCTD
jgi:hypothetical protein